jgi:8-oxo-dGTP diphosphatase
MPGDLLTTTEAAKLLGVDRSTVTRYVRLGKLPAVRLPSGHARIRRADVDRVLRDGVDVEQERPTRANPAAAASPAIATSTATVRTTTERPAIAAAIIVQDGRVLMTRRRYSEGSLVWGFPTGEVEPGESPEQAAVREVQEEIALEVAVERRLGERTHPNTGRHMVYMACRVVSGTADLVDHEELAELAWCALDELTERVPTGIFQPVQEYLERVLEPARPG